MSKVLSQEEVDALLKGLVDGDIEVKPDQAALEAGVVPYDFASQERIIRGRMPTMEVINEHFARAFRISLSMILRRTVDIQTNFVQMLKFGEFLKSLPLPSSFNIYKMDPLRGQGLMVVDSKLVFALVECFLGGSSGIIGLIDAIHKFDPGKNISFKTYAEFRIKGAILDELRSLDWIPRSVRKKSHVLERTYSELEKNLGRPAEPEEVCDALGLDLEEFYQLLDETKSVSLVELEGVWKAMRNGPEVPENDLPEILLDDNVRDPFLALHFSELQDIMVKAIDALPDKEKLLISLYYYEELTMKEIGQIMGYTESRISQLHTQAMIRLRSRLREYFQFKED